LREKAQAGRRAEREVETLLSREPHVGLDSGMLGL